MSQNPQMDVLYMQGFGHVLGIFTRTAEPGQLEADASAFVGDGLHMRGLVAGQDLAIPPALIALLRVDRNWRQILTATTLNVSPLPGSGASGTPSLVSFAAAAPTFTYAAPNLTITAPVGSFINGNILVLALAVAGGTPVQFTAQISAPQASVVVPLTGLVTLTSYNAFVFVPGFPIANYHFTP